MLKAADDAAAAQSQDAASATSSQDSMQETRSVVWEVNGRCTPHKVWIYPEGAQPQNGLCISVDRFGAAKVTSGGET